VPQRGWLQLRRPLLRLRRRGPIGLLRSAAHARGRVRSRRDVHGHRRVLQDLRRQRLHRHADGPPRFALLVPRRRRASAGIADFRGSMSRRMIMGSDGRWRLWNSGSSSKKWRVARVRCI
jgi:hypothetical protein